MDRSIASRLAGYHGACLDAERRGRYPTAWTSLRRAGDTLRGVETHDEEWKRWRERFLTVWERTASWPPEPRFPWNREPEPGEQRGLAL